MTKRDVLGYMMMREERYVTSCLWSGGRGSCTTKLGMCIQSLTWHPRDLHAVREQIPLYCGLHIKQQRRNVHHKVPKPILYLRCRYVLIPLYVLFLDLIKFTGVLERCEGVTTTRVKVFFLRRRYLLYEECSAPQAYLVFMKFLVIRYSKKRCKVDRWTKSKKRQSRCKKKIIWQSVRTDNSDRSMAQHNKNGLWTTE